MRESKFTKLLFRLTHGEMNRFEDYLSSPYHNKAPELRKYCLQIIEKVRHSRGPVNINDKAPANGNKHNPDLQHRGLQALYGFLEYEELSRLSSEKKLLLLQALQRRQLESPFQRQIKKIRKQSEHKQGAGQNYMAYRVDMMEDGLFGRSARRIADSSLKTAMHHLDLFYLLEKLQSCCELLNRSRILNEDFEAPMLNSLLTEIEQNPERYKGEPQILTYHKAINVLKREAAPASYFEFVKTLDTHAPAFSADALRQLYTYAQNYCIGRVNLGDESFLGHLLELYRKLLQNGVLIDEEGFSQSTYKNIVTLALRLKEFDWTLQFIEQYKEAVPPAWRNNAHAYNLANYYYSTADYEGAQKLLISVEFADVFYNLGAKTMLLKIYFEEQSFELLFSLIDAFRIYLRRDRRLSEQQRQAYRNLINLTKKLARLRSRMPYTPLSRTKRELRELQLKLRGTSPLMNVSWLKEQLGVIAS